LTNIKTGKKMAHLKKRLELIQQIENGIELPLNYKYTTGAGLRIVYRLNGWQEVVLQYDLDSAALLKDANLITTYTVDRFIGVQLWKGAELVADGNNNVYWREPQIIRIEDLEITRGIAVTLAALSELKNRFGVERTGIVRSLFNTTKKAA
jgi:hypothetical protein